MRIPPFRGWGRGAGQPWTCSWGDAHGMSIIGPPIRPPNEAWLAVTVWTQMLWMSCPCCCSLCCTPFFWKGCVLPVVPCFLTAPCQQKHGPTIAPPPPPPSGGNAKAFNRPADLQTDGPNHGRDSGEGDQPPPPSYWECHARSAHTVRSFGCRQILAPSLPFGGKTLILCPCFPIKEKCFHE